MNSAKRPTAKLIVLFGAVVLFQCCCCIIPYSWTARFDSSTFAAPLEKEEIHLSPPESLKAGNPYDGLSIITLNKDEFHTEIDLDAVLGDLSQIGWEKFDSQDNNLSWSED